MSKCPVFTIDENGERKCHFLDHQLAAARSKKKIAGIVGGRGCGKSIFLSAMAVSEIVQGGKVILFAQDFKALSRTLFKEIQDRFDECGFKPYVNNGNMTIKFNGGELYGYSYENVDSVRGLSECSMLVLDELATAPENLFETATPCLRGSKRPTRIIFATTPKKGTIWNRWFKDESIEKDIFTATMFDLPDEMISEEEKELQRKAIKDPSAFQQEMLGVILDDDIEFGIISKTEFPVYRKPNAGTRKMGVDLAGFGADNNVFVVSDNSGILDIQKIQIADTWKLNSIAEELIRKWDIKVVNLDNTGGYGMGLTDTLKLNNKITVNPINFGAKAKQPDRYVNTRTEMYMEAMDKIRNGFYVDDDIIKEELSYMSYSINNSGKTQLAPKADIKALLGHSPDTTDAMVLSLYDIQNEEEISPEEGLNIAMKFCSF